MLTNRELFKLLWYIGLHKYGKVLKLYFKIT